MKPTIFLLLTFLFSVSIASAQLQQHGTQRQISVYSVVAHTVHGKVKGTLYRVFEDRMKINANNGIQTIPALDIKSVKIKFDKEAQVPLGQSLVSNSIAQLSAPDDTKRAPDGTRLDSHGNPLYNGEEEHSLGERLLVNTAVITGAVVGDRLVRLIPKGNIEVFKINRDQDKFKRQHEDLAMYSVYLQSSPEYDKILRDKLRAAMKNTLKTEK
ncbi:hypothetical protein ACS126_04180 [Sphingobacterium lactis]|uniref:hypothetical protein n=1 Tax=Sphingobacterium lactis TaxID=797291 RepID=UPI003EC59CB3